MTTRLLILAGGQSEEHAVSLISARCVLDALAAAPSLRPTLHVIARDGTWLDAQASAEAVRRGEVVPTGEAPLSALVDAAMAHDVVLPLLHGPMGEDGTLQGLLTLTGVPFVGCGTLAAALCMDKPMAKEVLRAAGLPQVPYLLVTAGQWQADAPSTLDHAQRTLRGPWFVKPANMGSSVGILRAHDAVSLRAAVDNALRYDRRIIIEEGLEAPRELEVACLGNDAPQASPVGEICHDGTFYDYATKYTAGHSTMVIPAKIPDAVGHRIRELALNCYRLLDCAGLARIDFFYDTSSQQIYINEVNTMPGFTQFSMYPALWAAAGLAYGPLIEKLVALALERRREDARLP